ncbi:hypothetical protein ACQ4M4_00980 [Leptolyngbya sp. AN02str]|uniref:hypothetical protein n=1 Tax=Leptolyngbya sp. AN02str TaxID=3423363 RepID=UPI003D30FFAA
MGKPWGYFRESRVKLHKQLARSMSDRVRIVADELGKASRPSLRNPLLWWPNLLIAYPDWAFWMVILTKVMNSSLGSDSSWGTVAQACNLLIIMFPRTR